MLRNSGALQTVHDCVAAYSCTNLSAFSDHVTVASQNEKNEMKLTKGRRQTMFLLFMRFCAVSTLFQNNLAPPIYKYY